ncbi:unnamed protein product [Prunus brigantina]
MHMYANLRWYEESGVSSSSAKRCILCMLCLCFGRFRCDGEGDFWRKVRGLMCFRFLGNICFWWKIGGSLCAAMLTYVVVVYPSFVAIMVQSPSPMRKTVALYCILV